MLFNLEFDYQSQGDYKTLHSLTWERLTLNIIQAITHSGEVASVSCPQDL